jgi:ppGpp synthetase/RelA/SpoT-type nucleotidyltranferase
MNYNPRDIERIARSVASEIEDEIAKAGIFYRIFFRCKDPKSLNSKVNAITKEGEVKYNGTSKFLRDIIGIRVNLYFADDLNIVTNYIKEKYQSRFIEETIDQNKTTEFKPTRINIIYSLPDDCKAEFREVVPDNRIDSVFELQLRTVFSEGWHEVEHDFRYKCSEDWILYPDLSRTFNGILASLETHDWSTIQMFESLSYSHYKSGDISAMIRTKLRIRFSDFKLSGVLLNIIETEDGLQKEFFKLDRNSIITFLLVNRIGVPSNLENIIFLINYFFIKSPAIINITSEELINDFKKYKK